MLRFELRGAFVTEKLFRRFKADEASQSITAARRMISPEDNNERQAIHEHESVRLGPAAPKALTGGGAAR